jgi:predicted DNA-binding transcriptional regulator AlpA
MSGISAEIADEGYQPAKKPTLRSSWTVHVQLALPSDTTCRPLPSDYAHLDEVLEGRGPVFRMAPDSVEVLFGVEAQDAVDALSEANRLAPLVINILDPSREAAVTISLSEHLEGLPEEYAGMGEVAAILGVSKQRIYQLSDRKGFPEPAFRLKATPVWRTADIYQFRRTRR